MNKTKFFSSLLVAVLFATTSVFVSCKDYDDDIKNLQSQIDKAALKADLDALSTKLAGVESTANAAKTTAESALAKANANATEIAAVKATAEKAAADAAKALTDVAKAQSTADAAQKAAEAAQKTADEAATKKELADAVEKLDKAVEDLKAAAATKKELADAQEELKKYADAVKEAALAGAKAYTDEAVKSLATNAAVEKLSTDLNAEITGLKTTLAAITDEEKMAELVRIVGSFDTVVNTLFSAVTSVELISTYTGYIGHNIAFDNRITVKPFTLDMTTGTIAENSVFGDEHSTFRGETYDFVEGANIDFNSRALVRVSPVSADLTTAKILLVNSKGEGLDDYVEAGTPVRYEEAGALITRGTKIQSGLWFIPFSIKEGVSENDFKAATMVPNTKTAEPDDSISILYAVAINNTAENDADRYAVSSYDVETSYAVYSPVSTFDFTVNEKGVSEIRNRWNGTKAISKETSQTSTDFDLDAKELVWIANTPERKAAGLITPATEPGKYDKDGNGLTKLATAANNEIRWERKLLPVELNKAFTVELSKIDNEVAPEKKIQYYYVTLDERVFAVESNPSEWNAWTGYYSNIENLNKLIPAGESVDITINDAKANGDIIGFRVYAVNYDGTLADPDGRAFYVQVGDPASVNTVSGKYLATVADYHPFPANDKDAKENKYVELVEVDASNFAKVNITENKRAAAITLKSDADLNKDANAKVIFANDVQVHYTLLDKDKQLATKWQDIKYVAFSVNKPGYWLDNATATISIQEIEQGTGRVQNQLNVAITKTLPSSATSITWRTTLEPKDGVLTVYPMPSDATCSIANTGVQNITKGTKPSTVDPTNANYKWPLSTEVNSKGNGGAAKTTYALVDLGGYANMKATDSYTWYVSKVFKKDNEKKDVVIAGNNYEHTGASDYLHFMMATDPANVDSKTQFDSHIDGTFAKISCTKEEGQNAKTEQDYSVPNIWTGKVVFASLFNPDNGIVAYGNGTYRYNAYKAKSTNELESSDFFWFYGESTKLSGCFDVATNKGVAQDKDLKDAKDFKATKYFDMKSQPSATSTPSIDTQDAHIVKYGNPETAGFENWTAYALGKLFKVDFAGSNADAKQTSYLKAKNAGLSYENITAAKTALPTYISYNDKVTLSEAAATVMTVTSDGTNLTFAAKPGKQVVAKTANQSATIGAIDQFGVAVPNMTFKFTIMPETMAVENAK